MDDRELDARLTNIENKVNVVIVGIGELDKKIEFLMSNLVRDEDDLEEEPKEKTLKNIKIEKKEEDNE